MAFFIGIEPNQIDTSFPQALQPLTIAIPTATEKTSVGEQTFLAAGAAAPTLTPENTQGAFYVANVTNRKEVHPLWQVKGRFETANSAASYASVVLWSYDRDTEEWYPSRRLEFYATLSTSNGNIYTMEGVFGTKACYFQVDGLTGTDDLRLVMRPATHWKRR